MRNSEHSLTVHLCIITVRLFRKNMFYERSQKSSYNEFLVEGEFEMKKIIPIMIAAAMLFAGCIIFLDNDSDAILFYNIKLYSGY